MRSKKGLILNDRDRDVLKFVFERRVATRSQIGRNLFKDAKFQTVHRRLERLVKEYYLAKSVVSWPTHPTISYSVAVKGLEKIKDNFPFQITSDLLKSDSVIHDLCLNEIREQVEKAKNVASYFSENVLQACRSFEESEDFRPFVALNSDAALVLRTPNGNIRVALEYEASDKDASRYSKKLLDYYLSPKVAGVFYLCANADIENLIRRVDSTISQKFEPKVFTSTHSSLHLQSKLLPFTNLENAEIAIE